MAMCPFAQRNCTAKVDSDENMCFMATPCAEEVQARVDSIINAAGSLDLNCIVAERHKEYNRDIFCQKICRPIIESRFCIVLLDESRPTPERSPGQNPNVYYEYGMMSVRSKEILAFSPKGQVIPFNVRHLEIIPYTEKGLYRSAREEMERALKRTAGRAAAAERARRRAKRRIPGPLRSAQRVAELRQFSPAIPAVVGASASDDTCFESWVGEESLLFIGYLRDSSATADEMRKDAVLLVDRLGRMWEEARKTSIAAKSRGWRSAERDAKRDMALVSSARLVAVGSLEPVEVVNVQKRIGASIEAPFGQISIDVWGKSELVQEEKEVRLRMNGSDEVSTDEGENII